MRIVVRVTERYYDRVLEKIRARGFSRIRENKALCLISFELPKTKSEFLHELTEDGATVERNSDWE